MTGKLFRLIAATWYSSGIEVHMLNEARKKVCEGKMQVFSFILWKKKKTILLLARRAVPNILQKFLKILSSCMRAMVRVLQWIKRHDCLACDIYFSLIEFSGIEGKRRIYWQADPWEGSQSSLVTFELSVQLNPSTSPGKWNILLHKFFCQLIPTSTTIASVSISLGVFLLWSGWVVFPVYHV